MTAMPSHTEAVDRMLAVWNERDPSRVRGRLESALSPDVLFIDPTIETRGLAEFEQNVRGFRAKYPEAVISRSSGVDSHHRLHRYGWQIAIGRRIVLVGFDVSESADDGRICRVLGFFGPLPEREPEA